MKLKTLQDTLNTKNTCQYFRYCGWIEERMYTNCSTIVDYNHIGGLWKLLYDFQGNENFYET